MKFFIDTANVDEIKELHDLGFVDGVTTNPSLILKSGRDIIEVTEEICSLVAGPVSVEVASDHCDGMLAEAKVFTKLKDNVCIKLPITFEGLKACRALTQQGIKTNVTLCFSPTQALLAAKAGATYISPFVGRLDDAMLDGMNLVSEIRTIYDNYDFQTQILVASIRTVNHVKEAALIGADVATIPAAILKALVKHPLTDKGLEQFVADWKKTGQSIIKE